MILYSRVFSSLSGPFRLDFPPLFTRLSVQCLQLNKYIIYYISYIHIRQCYYYYYAIIVIVIIASIVPQRARRWACKCTYYASWSVKLPLVFRRVVVSQRDVFVTFFKYFFYYYYSVHRNARKQSREKSPYNCSPQKTRILYACYCPQCLLLILLLQCKARRTS